MNPTNSQTNLPLPSLTQVTSRWPIIPISPKLPDGAAIISDRAHIYSLSPEYSSSESDSSNTVENPVVQSAKEKLVSFSIQQEAAIWDTMLALCASKSNAGRQAGNYIPFQGITPYNLEGNATEAWVITGLRLSKQTGSITLSKVKDLQYILETTLKPTIKSFPKYPPRSSFSAMQYGRSQVASFMEDNPSSTLAISSPHFQIPLQSSSPSQP